MLLTLVMRWLSLHVSASWWDENLLRRNQPRMLTKSVQRWKWDFQHLQISNCSTQNKAIASLTKGMYKEMNIASDLVTFEQHQLTSNAFHSIERRSSMLSVLWKTWTVAAGLVSSRLCLCIHLIYLLILRLTGKTQFSLSHPF